ncbi:MAG: hypothetical protein MUF52_07165 [Syntrophobacteraceae bacterium]|jgi:hypothetical protein|nr:hypothetical protein [Syntrophobacteraceae bacterium]
MNGPYFSTRDYVFAALMACGLLLVGSIIVPMTLPLRIPGLTNAATAPFSSFFLVIGLMRLRKPGSLLLIAGIYGLVCLAISPVIFGFVLAGGVFGEVICTLAFRGYAGKIAPVMGAVLYEVGMFPAAMILSLFFIPERYTQPAVWIWIVAEIAIVATSLAGALCGLKVAKELARAGKLQLET